MARLAVVTGFLCLLAGFAMLDYDGSLESGWPWVFAGVVPFTVFLFVIRRRWFFLSGFCCWWFVAFALIMLCIGGGTDINRRVGLEEGNALGFWWVVLLPFTIIIPMLGFRRLFAQWREHATSNPKHPYGSTN